MVPPAIRPRSGRGGAPVGSLYDANIENLVEEYLKLDSQRGWKNPDPIDDCMESLRYLQELNPSMPFLDLLPVWERLADGILIARHAGTCVRIRKNPLFGKLFDARTMQPDDLMKKHGISRSHAFDLRKRALKMMQAEARRKK